MDLVLKPILFPCSCRGGSLTLALGSQPCTSPQAWRKGRGLRGAAPEPRGGAGSAVGGTEGEPGPAYQLHAQAVLLPGVVTVNLLLDLLKCGRALRLLRGFADILEHRSESGYAVYDKE